MKLPSLASKYLNKIDTIKTPCFLLSQLSKLTNSSSARVLLMTAKLLKPPSFSLLKTNIAVSCCHSSKQFFFVYWDFKDPEFCLPFHGLPWEKENVVMGIVVFIIFSVEASFQILRFFLQLTKHMLPFYQLPTFFLSFVCFVFYFIFIPYLANSLGQKPPELQEYLLREGNIRLYTSGILHSIDSHFKTFYLGG